MGGGEAEISKEGKFRVFVLMGQSNMHGLAHATELTPPYSEKHDRIRIWANGRWEYLVPRQEESHAKDCQLASMNCKSKFLSHLMPRVIVKIS